MDKPKYIHLDVYTGDPIHPVDYKKIAEQRDKGYELVTVYSNGQVGIQFVGEVVAIFKEDVTSKLVDKVNKLEKALVKFTTKRKTSKKKTPKVEEPETEEKK